MKNSDTEDAAARAALAVEIVALKNGGLSFPEIAAMLSTDARPLTRNAVTGIYHRLQKQHQEDAQDLRILEQIEMKAQTLNQIAKNFRVTLAHVEALKRECLQ